MFLLLLEYWAYAMRHPELRESFVERFGAFRDTTARWVEDDLPEDALERMALAMMTGIREWTLERRKPRRGR
jgi:DUF438 domain-containing protein